ncbi:endonuclease domain-containing protein [Winogradskyella flava]|nr:endonuclease domain-containing protein [Winogradskyella flava]
MEEGRLKKNGMHNKAHPIIFKNAARLRDNMTESERLLWKKLRLKPQGFKFRRQHPISSFVLDFYCHKIKLSIEIDGDYHLTKEQQVKDKERTEAIKELGIKEIRFRNKDVTDDIENVMLKINSELRAGSL